MYDVQYGNHYPETGCLYYMCKHKLLLMYCIISVIFLCDLELDQCAAQKHIIRHTVSTEEGNCVHCVSICVLHCVYMKVTTSYHSYYMILWKQFMLFQCPQLLFKHACRSCLSPVLNYFHSANISPFIILSLYIIHISWHTCVCRCLCVIMYLCVP